MLSPSERAFMTRLQDQYRGGWALCRTNPPNAAIQSLADRGYCRLSAARCGPLGVTTGEVLVGLTEAGKAALQVATLPA